MATGSIKKLVADRLAPRERLWVLDSGCDRAYLLPRSAVLSSGGAG